MSTIEIRSWLDRAAGYRMQNEIIWWKQKTPVEVRDALYPGTDLRPDVAQQNSLSPAAMFCNGWQVIDTTLGQVPSGHNVYLIELP